MKLCLKEAMKRISLLEQQKRDILSDESSNCMTTYGAGEEKEKVEYDFTDVRTHVAALDSEIRRIKHNLHLANATVRIDEFDMTLGECIIYLAQLNNEKGTLERMARRELKTRKTAYGGGVEWTELNYSREACREQLKKVTEDIVKLQMVIDRSNLTHEIEV